MKAHLQSAWRILAAALFAILVLAPPAHSGYQPTPTGTGFVTVTGGLQNAASKAFPTGTGFYHATAGSLDSASSAVALTSTDVTGILPIAKGGTNLSTIGADGTTLRSNGTTWAVAYTTDPTIDGLRISVTQDTPITSSDFTSSTIWLCPYRSGSIAIYDGSGWVVRSTSSSISLSLGTLTAGKNYDVFAYWSGGPIAMLLSNPWTSDTVRADGITRQDGVWVKTGAPGQRYIGTIRALNTTQTTDTVLQRFVYNEANQVRRTMAYVPAATWAYAGTALRQAAGATGTSSYRTEFVFGTPGPVESRIVASFFNANTNVAWFASIGVDSTTTASGSGAYSGTTMANVATVSTADYAGTLSLGYHSLYWLENASGSGCNVIGSATGASSMRTSVWQ